MTSLWLLLLFCSPLCQPDSVEGWGVSTVPSESECRPYIEKALKERSPQEAVDTTGSEQVVTPSTATEQEGSIEETEENNTKESKEDETDEETQTEGSKESSDTGEVTDTSKIDNDESSRESESVQGDQTLGSEDSGETPENTAEDEAQPDKSTEETEDGNENVTVDQPSVEDGSESAENDDNITHTEQTSTETKEAEDEPTEGEQSAETPDEATTTEDKSIEEESKSDEETIDGARPESGNEEETATEESGEEKQDEATEESIEKTDSVEKTPESHEDQEGEESAEVPGGEVTDSAETTESLEDDSTTENASKENVQPSEENTIEASVENDIDSKQNSSEASGEATDTSVEELNVTRESTEDTEVLASTEELSETKEETKESSETPDDASDGSTEEKEIDVDSGEDKDTNATLTDGRPDTTAESSETSGETEEQENAEGEDTANEPEATVEDQLTLEFEAPSVRRPRDHITEILNLSPEAAETELLLAKTIDSTLKELKKLYDAAIKPLEILFKYRDLSNRHFGDPEIFSKPLILFMGPWSGGKSTILNYLLDNEFKSSSLRTGAEPSPAYFNILMWGEREEVLDGTQLAADWTFSGLQKFGQGLLDRLRGLKLNSPLLEKVNIVEIPGILEIRKQVERLFPFNDACQWFIDRADIIFLVYDPSKLDVGPETEAILDQLKGREYQTRIILNKADQVKPEELMRVQGTLIWNISPLMSSMEPPVMYSTSLWSLPYEQGAPSRLLHAQERAFLRDLRQAIDKRVENKIASARRFAVRVRNHAKMVDCYLTTYYNHKSFFGNKKKVADDIIEHPQNYHIYEGLSTLTNISRYDLPDPEVYRDFFRLNPLYDFQRLSETCTYFRGCPINRLDVAIAYDLPELVGKYKKQADKLLEIAVDKQATKS